jgi:hypothetical protein
LRIQRSGFTDIQGLLHDLAKTRILPERVQLDNPQLHA